MIENVATYMTYDIHWRCHSAMPCTHMGQTSKILSNLDFFQRLFDLGHQNLPFGCCYEKINNKKKQDISHTVCGDGPRGRHSSMRAHFRLSQRIPSQWLQYRILNGSFNFLSRFCARLLGSLLHSHCTLLTHKQLRSSSEIFPFTSFVRYFQINTTDPLFTTTEFYDHLSFQTVNYGTNAAFYLKIYSCFTATCHLQPNSRFLWKVRTILLHI